ncbi:50S ribosomal protein L6 [Candidatus Woesebacteria bacterium]|nr:50S ribosomal protein L6 [Candidatus Woesebacteria bacterium]
MSRIGKQPINLIQGVTSEISGNKVKITGPKGTLELVIPRSISVDLKDNLLIVSKKGDSKSVREVYGTTRALLANIVKGVSEGWSKELELVGVGFRAEVQGSILVLNVGFSHQVKVPAPSGITFKVEKLVIRIEGIDKEMVGRTAADIRSIRPPEPYKGKGIKYRDEIVRRKPGKAAAKATIG